MLQVIALGQKDTFPTGVTPVAWRRRGASLNHIKKEGGNATPVLNLRYPASLCTFRGTVHNALDVSRTF